jgi:predicted aspartyl protease
VKRARKFISLLFLCEFFACGSLLAQNCEGLNHVADMQAPQSIHLRIYHNFLVVAEGGFSCAGERQNFVLDTGASPSIINSRLANRLELTTRQSFTNTFGNPTASRTAIVAEIDLGPVRVLSLPVQIQDLSRLERDLGLPIAAVIGFDVLSKSNFCLDYENKRLTFACASEGGISISVGRQAGIAVAKVTLDGRPARMLVDTGSDRVVLLAGNSAESNQLVLNRKSQENTDVSGQVMRTQVLFGKNMALGTEHFNLRKVYVLPGNRDPEFDGLLGVRALGFRVVAYNRASATMFLQK